jgi:replicative DNA helicase
MTAFSVRNSEHFENPNSNASPSVPEEKVVAKTTSETPVIKPSKSTGPWKRYSDILQESVDYAKARQQGKIKSLKTTWKGFNSIGLNGIEWQSLYVLAARPGVGKTLIAATLTRGLQRMNPDQKFAVLHFQFEMLGRNMGMRELSSGTNLNIRYIQSSQDDGMPALSEADWNKLKNYADLQNDREEYVVDRALTVSQMKDVITAFYKEVKIPIVITLDHAGLVKQSVSDTSKQQTLQNLSTMLTEVKNALPVTFLILTQLNRDIDNAERQKPGKLENYPTEADVYGSDYLLQCADVMIAYNRPAKYNLSLYGPSRFVISPSDKYLLAMHVLKNRFGELSIQWYQADYATMSVLQVREPSRATKATV